MILLDTRPAAIRLSNRDGDGVAARLAANRAETALDGAARIASRLSAAARSASGGATRQNAVRSARQEGKVFSGVPPGGNLALRDDRARSHARLRRAIRSFVLSAIRPQRAGTSSCAGPIAANLAIVHRDDGPSSWPARGGSHRGRFRRAGAEFVGECGLASAAACGVLPAGVPAVMTVTVHGERVER